MKTGSHAILVLPIPFEVTNKMPTMTNGYRRPESMSLRVAINKWSIRISHKFPLFTLSWWFHVIFAVTIELNSMAYA